MTALVIWRVLAALAAALASMTYQPQEDEPVVTCVDTVCMIPPAQASRP